MSPAEHQTLERLAAELRQLARAGGAPLSIDQAQALPIADALARVLQSSKRLRSQNAKLRRRVENLKAGGTDPGDDADGED